MATVKANYIISATWKLAAVLLFLVATTGIGNHLAEARRNPQFEEDVDDISGLEEDYQCASRPADCCERIKEQSKINDESQFWVYSVPGCAVECCRDMFHTIYRPHKPQHYQRGAGRHRSGGQHRRGGLKARCLRERIANLLNPNWRYPPECCRLKFIRKSRLCRGGPGPGPGPDPGPGPEPPEPPGPEPPGPEQPGPGPGPSPNPPAPPVPPPPPGPPGPVQPTVAPSPVRRNRQLWNPWQRPGPIWRPPNPYRNFDPTEISSLPRFPIRIPWF